MMPAPGSAARLAAAFVLAAVLAGAAGASELSDLRAQRRAGVRTAAQAAAKSGGGAPFALLVIPVDFDDARLPAGWQPAPNLGPRLDGAGRSLRSYFATASGGACDLRITLAPLVSLPGARRDYSDLGLNGFTRTRRLAREAITAVRDLGLELRRLDNDGPDGLAGTADDDGQVDGVLILHAGIGLENDLASGLIQPLQFFLDEPVVADGVTASFYAVASMGSGLGIWAHETAHLLGLEERYDLRFAASGASEIHSRGGLGRFSLMAAGAWGTGGGHEPALPDAYSCLQLGWYRAVDLPRSGAEQVVLQPAVRTRQVHRVWTHGLPGDEYFLLEVREPYAGFDQAVPGGDLVIYHVDERVPETAWSTEGGVHLRVQLVEADGNTRLRDGLDEGSADDLFPGTTGAAAFGAATAPASAGYRGPSLVELTGIARTAVAGVPAVACTVRADAGPAVEIRLGFASAPPRLLQLEVLSVGSAVTGLSARVAAAAPAWGGFAGGGTAVDLVLQESAPGVWTPVTAPGWQPDPDLPAGAATRFVVTVAGDGWTAPAAARTWAWGPDPGGLDFAAAWPGAWTVAHPDGEAGTTWHRWDERSPAVAAGRFVLACADSDHPTGEAWPAVAYDNRAHATLTSGLLGPGITAVRLVHAWDSEALAPGVLMDGGAAFWVGPDGGVIEARPRDGWPGRIDGQSLAALHGRPAWGGPGDLGPDDRPIWRTDVLPLPDQGPGPWRLRLVFASNTRDWNHRGWLIHSIEALTEAPPASALPVAWDARELAWVWPGPPAGDPRFVVQRRQDGAWVDLLERWYEPPFDGGRFTLPAADLLAALPGPGRRRSEVRILGPWGAPGEGLLASSAIVVFPDGGGGAPGTLGAPWPNPSTTGVRFMLTVADGRTARVGIYDLAGRRAASWDYPPGEHFVRWDGTGPDGRRVAAGTYILRLEGSEGVLTHKVVLLH